MHCKTQTSTSFKYDSCLLFQTHLPYLFWNFVVQHATFLINCTPTPLLQNSSPYEKLNDNICDLSNLRVLGCLWYSNTLTSHRKKLVARSVHGIFLGFQHHTKGYIFLNLKNHKIEVSRHVIFHETNFPYQLTTDVQKNPNNLSLPLPPNYDSKCDLSFSSTPYIVKTTATTTVKNVVNPPFMFNKIKEISNLFRRFSN